MNAQAPVADQATRLSYQRRRAEEGLGGIRPRRLDGRGRERLAPSCPDYPRSQIGRMLAVVHTSCRYPVTPPQTEACGHSIAVARTEC